MEKEEYLQVYRHSLAHILAKAVIEIYGDETQYAIGPQIEDGCYYDFVLPRTVTEDDFKTIEDKMHEIIKRRGILSERKYREMKLSQSSRIRNSSQNLFTICLRMR